MGRSIVTLACALLLAARSLPTEAQEAAGLRARPVVLKDCPVRPLQEVKVPTRVAGVIDEVYVKKGSVVKKGDKLARLDDKLARIEHQAKSKKAKSEAAILEADAALEEAEAKVDDGERLGRAIPAEEMRVRRAQKKVATFRLVGAKEEKELDKLGEETAKTQLNYHEVTSPIDGEVVEQFKQLGESVQVLDPVFRMIRTDVVRVEANLNIRDSDLVRSGSPIEVFPNKQSGPTVALRGHTSPVLAVCVLPSGKYCASAGADGAVAVWNVVRGVRERLLATTGVQVHGLAASKANPTLLAAGGDDRMIRAWDVITGEQIHSVATNASPIRSIALSPIDGSFCVTGHEDRLIRVWNLATGELAYTLGGHTNYITSLAITPDGRRLLSASNDQTLRLWDLTPDAQKRDLRTMKGRTADARQIGISPDGKAYLFNSYGLLEVRGTEDDAALATIEGDRFGYVKGNFMAAAVFSPVPGLILAGDDNQNLHLWQLGTEDRHARLVRVFEGHGDLINAVDFAPDGSFVASACSDRTVRLFRVDPIEQINRERTRGKIEFKNQQAEAGSQTLAIHAEVQNKDHHLVPGGFATMIVYPHQTATAQSGK